MALAIQAKKRTESPAVVRANGNLPAVMYGHGIEPVSIEIKMSEFEKLYQEAGESTLVDLVLDGQAPVKVLIQDTQVDPIRRRFVHADFRQINMNEELSTTIELNFVGVAPAVKEMGGTLVKGLEYLNVRCLPKDLVSEITVDVSVLATFDDTIHISDLQLPTGLTCDDEMDTVLAKVSAPMSEEELKAMEEASTQVSVDSIEVEKKGKEEKAEEPAE